MTSLTWLSQFLTQFIKSLTRFRRISWQTLHLVTVMALVGPGLGDVAVLATNRPAHERAMPNPIDLSLSARLDSAPVGVNLEYSPVMFIENVGQFHTPAGVTGDSGPRFQVRGAGGTIYLAPNAVWVTVLEPFEEDDIPGIEAHAPPLPSPTPLASVTLEISPTPEPSMTTDVEASATPEASATIEASLTPEASPTLETSATLDASRTPETSPTAEASAVGAESSASPEANPTAESSATPEASAAPEVSATPESSITPEASATASAEVSVTPEPSLTSEASAIPEVSPTPKPRKQNNFRLSFVGANPNPQIVGFDRLETHISYFLGDDSSKWHADVPVWAGVRYVDLYPGLDLEITSREDEWQWRLVQRPVSRGQASLQNVRLQVDGAESLGLAGKGLRLKSTLGDFELPLLQVRDEDGLSLSAQALQAAGVGRPNLVNNQVLQPFTPGAGSGSGGASGHGLRDLIMSHAQYPGAERLAAPLTTATNPSALIYSTYLGGSGNDIGKGIAVDASGSVYVVGESESTDFPTKPSQADPDNDDWDTVVSKLNANGSGLIYSAYLGNSGDDYGRDIAVDASGAAYIAWSTTSTAKVTKLSATGMSVVYTTSLGGSGGAGTSGIALDTSGQAYVVGNAGSNFPTTTGAAQETYSGNGDVFVAKLNASGTQVYATYFGGTSGDDGKAIAVDINGAAYITGQTVSTDVVTTTGAFQTSNHSGNFGVGVGYDAFVAKLSSDGSAWDYSTYLGGLSNDRGYGIAVDQAGSAYVTGSASDASEADTDEEKFPITAGAYQFHNGAYYTQFGCHVSYTIGCPDAFVTKFKPDGSGLVYSTYLGGLSVISEESGNDIALDASSAAYVTGSTISSGFPTEPGAYQLDAPGEGECCWGFLSKLSPAGNPVPYSSYWGASRLAVNGQAVYLIGTDGVAAPDVPTTAGAYDRTHNGGSNDIFVAEFRTSSGIPPESVASPPSGDGSKLGPAAMGGDPRECGCSTAPGTQGYGGDPINTQTGGFAFSAVDLSVPTVAGPLVFQRTYASTITDTTTYTTTLGPGWTHNQDVRLIFPNSPGGENGKVWFKAHSANQYQFDIITSTNNITTYVPFAGVLASLTYTTTPTTVYTLTNPNQATYVFNGEGKITQWIDPEGHTLVYSYTAGLLPPPLPDPTRGQLDRVTDPVSGRYLQFTYDLLTPGRLISVSDHTGRHADYGYSPTTSDLITATDVLGQNWTYIYTGTTHLLTDAKDPRGITAIHTDYDSQARAWKQTDALNQTLVQIQYNLNGTTVLTDARGFTETHTYDAYNTLIGDTQPLGSAMSKSYDANFRPALVTDPLSHTTSLAWDASGANPTQVTDALTQTTYMTYDTLNNLTQTVDTRGYTTTMSYTGTLLSVITDTLNNHTLYTYTTASDSPQPVGLLKATTDGRGDTTQYKYDSLGQRTVMTDALGVVSNYTYDTLGRLITTTVSVGTPQQQITVNQYDNAGRLTKVIRNYLAGQAQNYQNLYNLVTQYAYDSVGSQTIITDTLGRATRTDYDNLNRPITVTVKYVNGLFDSTKPDEDIASTTGYDSNGNVVTTTQYANIAGLARTTLTQYDALNRPVTVTTNYVDGTFVSTKPDEDIQSLTGYDLAGNVVTTTQYANIAGLARTTFTQYDVLNRPITVTTRALC